MRNNIESQKVKIKEAFSKVIDEHFEEFSERAKDPNFKIDQIEELMLEQHRKIREALNESNGELISSIENNIDTDVKKNVKNAEDC